MKDVLRATYELYEKKLNDLFVQSADAKRMLNMLAKDMGMPEIPYKDVSIESSAGLTVKIKPGQFFNKALAASVREYLEMYKEARPWDEIVRGLRDGGFDLPKTKQAEDDARMTVLRNTNNFSLVPPNHFGLKTWYAKDRPKLNIKMKKKLEEIKTPEEATEYAVEKLKEQNGPK